MIIPDDRVPFDRRHFSEARSRTHHPTIGLVPANASHLTKNLVTIRELENRGARPFIFCLDNLVAPRHRVFDQVKNLGLDYHLVEAHGFRHHTLWVNEALQSRQLRRAFESALQRQPVDVIVFFSADNVIPNKFARVARERGIRSALIPDGLICSPVPGFRRSLKETVSYSLRRLVYGWTPRGAGEVDRVLVINAGGRDALVSDGVQEDKISVVGSPEYDDLASRLMSSERIAEEQEIRRRIGIHDNRDIVMFAHQSLIDEATTKSVIHCLVQGCRKANADLLVKLHPSAPYDDAALRSWCSSLDDSIRVRLIRRECSSVDAVRISSICVTAWSTVSIEAMICGVPLVFLQYLTARYRLDFADRYGVGIDVWDRSSLSDSVANLLSNHERRLTLAAQTRSALQAEFGGFDGRSTERSADAIMALVELRTSV